MPIDFPSSPTTGDVYTYLGKSWVYNGTGWDVPRSLSEIGAVQTFANAAARDAAIPSPTEGIVTYLNDTDALQAHDGSAWVPATGLTHIRTVTVPSGTGSVSINNVFSNTYRNYQIILNIIGTGTPVSFFARLRANGVDSSANYDWQVLYAAGTGVSAFRLAGDTAGFRVSGISNHAWSSVELTINEPALAKTSSGFVRSQYYIPYEYEQAAWRHRVDAAYDGITFTAGGTTFGGTITIYGLKA